jgi:hypothetical protein
MDETYFLYSKKGRKIRTVFFINGWSPFMYNKNRRSDFIPFIEEMQSEGDLGEEHG